MNLHFILGSPWGKLNSGHEALSILHLKANSAGCCIKKWHEKRRHEWNWKVSWEATVLVRRRETVTVFKIWPFKAKMMALNCAAAAAKSPQSCPTLCDPIDGSPSGSPIPGILQARTLEWVAISFSNEWKWKVKVKSLSPVWLFVTQWTAAYQAPLSMGFSRQECWSGLPLPSPLNCAVYSIFYLCSLCNIWR